MRLVATAAYVYAGQQLRTGEVFEAADRDAQILKVIGRATDAPPDDASATSRKTPRKRAAWTSR